MELVKHTYTVGDDVSYGFNGDWYYGGKVEKITTKFLTTDRGNKYSLKVIHDRKKVVEADGFVDYVPCLREVFVSVHGGTWALTKGIVEKQNPHF